MIINPQYVQSVRIPLNKNKKKATIICFEDPMPNFVYKWNPSLSGIDWGSSVSKQEEPVSEEKISPDTVKSANGESSPDEGRLDWNVDDPNSIMEACSKFLSMRKAGYTFYRLVGEDGSRLLMNDFDQNYPNIYFNKNKNNVECRRPK